MFKATVFTLILSGFTFACGRDEFQSPDANDNENENPTLIAADETSTLTSLCGDVPVPKIGVLSYCKTTASGNVTKIDLKPVTYVQDPETCEISSPDDGMLNTIIEMGFEPCES